MFVVAVPRVACGAQLKDAMTSTRNGWLRLVLPCIVLSIQSMWREACCMLLCLLRPKTRTRGPRHPVAFSDLGDMRFCARVDMCSSIPRRHPTFHAPHPCVASSAELTFAYAQHHYCNTPPAPIHAHMHKQIDSGPAPFYYADDVATGREVI